MAQLAGEQVHSRPALPCARCGVEQALRIAPLKESLKSLKARPRPKV